MYRLIFSLTLFAAGALSFIKHPGLRYKGEARFSRCLSMTDLFNFNSHQIEVEKIRALASKEVAEISARSALEVEEKRSQLEAKRMEKEKELELKRIKSEFWAKNIREQLLEFSYIFSYDL